MNLSKAISHVKLQLGLYNYSLPFKDDVTGETTPVENVIRDVFTTVTMPIYSQYVPWIRECTANIAHLRVVDRTKRIYILPGEVTTTPVMYVLDVHMPLHSYSGVYGDVTYASPNLMGAGGIGGAAQAVIRASEAMLLTGQLRAEPSWDYIGENKIRLYGYPRVPVVFRVACEHEPNGETIEHSCYDSFMQLAMLDVKMFLYNTLKLFDNVSSAFGPISLKLDEMQAADSERTALLQQWSETFHLDLDLPQFM